MAKRVLFIDRDGTLIHEPEDRQIDSLEKLEYFPKVFQGLSKIAKLDFELVMITNQDGLGTDHFPEEKFWPAQNKMMEALEGEGIHFSEVFIDKTFKKENKPTRKPGTALLNDYIDNPDYDLENSFVIGDRISDVKLAQNLGGKGIWINTGHGRGLEDVKESLEEMQPHIALETTDWNEIYDFLKKKVEQPA